MAGYRAGRRRLGSVTLAGSCLVVAAAIGWSLFNNRADSLASGKAIDGAEITGSIDGGPKAVGPSGLPIPRFVSLKTEKVNVRRGPSSDHAVAWVFQRKGLPVEIVAEFETWRRIRDSDGEEGWILQNMLAGKRTAMVAPWRPGQAVPLYRQPQPDSGLVAQVSAGVVSDIFACTGTWCEVSAGGYEGWMEQTLLWGVYPGKTVD